MARQSTAIVKNSAQAFGQIRNYLMAKQQAIANIAPKYLDTERMIRLALGASSRAPRLLQCTPKSWLMALMDCAFYGLEPNPVLGHAYLIPFQNNKLDGRPYEVQFLAGYKGLILLATETGGFQDVEGRIVYEGEKFEEIPEDPMRPFRHRPRYDVDKDTPILGAYAVGWRGPDQRPRFRFVPRPQIEEYRKRSRAAKSGPWVTDWNAMAMKTAARRMLAMASMRPGSKLGAALDQESALDRGEVIRANEWQVGDDEPAEEPKSQTDQLADELAQKAAEPPAPEPEFDA
ncbi:MAG: recombinase RecT [Deltaproteobacteria bacterium]|nr:recombinase RecT [Deltaproteobacteria bacterium]